MRALFFLFVLLSVMPCKAQEIAIKETKVIATVTEINNDTAKIETLNNKIKYLVDSRELETGKEYYFKLTKIEWVHALRIKKATIIERPVKTCKTVEEEAREYFATSKL